MAAAKPADAVMPLAELKSLLAQARRGNPVFCAVALTADKDALLLLDRRKAPRKLSAELRSKAKDAGLELTTLRFGRAEVNGAEDAGSVTFTVNKEAPAAFQNKLVALLRPVGFTRAEIVVDEGGDDEPDADASGDAALAAALVAVGKSGKVWAATLDAVERQVNELLDKLKAAYHGHGFAAKLDSAFHAKVEPMLEAMDASLVHKLAELAASTDTAARAQALTQVRSAIAKYEAFLESDTLIAQLDANPLVPLSIADTLTTSLDALARALDKVPEAFHGHP